METKTTTEFPSIANLVQFEILTPDELGCFTRDPYKVGNVTIYYLVRDFTHSYGEFSNPINIPTEQAISNYETAQETFCATNPSNVDAYNAAYIALQVAKLELESSTLPLDTGKIYYSEAKSVAVYGDANDPAWLSSDVSNALITLEPFDAVGNPQKGHFSLVWNPAGMREGDYFITWTWNTLPASTTLTASEYFSLKGSTQLTTSIPTHRTVPGKYETLLDRYRPEMFKMFMSTSDLSPLVLQGLDEAVALGFTSLEDMANQSLDLIDANATHESLLTPLANLFSLKLRSGDPTLWRRQVKSAVPLAKKRGTLSGLQDALSQAGISLKRFSKLWQVISFYTVQDYFQFNGSTTFDLSRAAILPINPLNLELYYRHGAGEWVNLTSDYTSYITFVDNRHIQWVVQPLMPIGSPHNPDVGDSIRLIYEVAPVPPSEQGAEIYLRTLPLSDDRDEQDQDCPLKNWNVRLIAEDDPWFNTLVSERYPYHEPLIYGWVRTEFPYSENIYNNEEYNGSSRESTDPCNIDCDFLDPCRFCQSSKFDLDLEVGNLGDDRKEEALQIIDEFKPFHALVNRIGFQGSMVDLMQPPLEEIQGMVQYLGQQLTLSGPQVNFNRNPFEALQLRRDELANQELIDSGMAMGYNEQIVLFSPNVPLDEYSLQNNILQVLGPNPNSGFYTLDYFIDSHRAVVHSVLEPFYSGNFTFRSSAKLFDVMLTTITQDNVFTFRDSAVQLANYSIHGSSEGTLLHPVLPWKVFIAALGQSYEVIQVLSDGGLVLANGTPALPSASQSGIMYSLLDPADNVVLGSTTGVLWVQFRGRVDAGSTVGDIQDAVQLDGSYFFFLNSDWLNQYPITGFVEGHSHQFYIDGYAGSNMAGVQTVICHRYINNAVGNFAYDGLRIVTSTNYEVSLDIQNGANHLSLQPVLEKLKENYLLKIGSDYYAMQQIDGVTITLSGPAQTWYLFGTPVPFEIYQFSFIGPYVYPTTTDPNIPGHTLDYINRRSGEVIDSTETLMALSIKNSVDQNRALDVIGQAEEITYSIEYKKGD